MTIGSDDLRQCRLLIVDDMPANLALLRDILAPSGCKLSFTTSGESALELVMRIAPDLILLDVMMPGIDGYETCVRLKAHEDTRDIPVIFVTARTSMEDLAKGFAVGGVDYITKPLERTEVEARVQAHLKIRTLSLAQTRIIHLLNGTLQEKSKGVASLGHELRSPLNAIIGYSEMVKEDLLEHGLHASVTSVEAVIEAGKYLVQLITNILDLAKLDAGKLATYVEEFELATLFTAVKRTTQPLAAKNANTLRFEDVDLIMRSDSMKIKQILINLISNACKFTKAGEIVVGAHSDQARISITVSDNGIGMSDEQVANLFQDYAQVGDATARDYGGTGLGLSLSQQLSQLLGGEIQVRSQLNAGATFTLDLPLELMALDSQAQSA